MKESFLQAYDTHVDTLFAYCYRKTGDRELAKYFTEETFMKAWNRAASGESIDIQFLSLKEIARESIHNARVTGGIHSHFATT